MQILGLGNPGGLLTLFTRKRKLFDCLICQSMSRHRVRSGYIYGFWVLQLYEDLGPAHARELSQAVCQQSFMYKESTCPSKLTPFPKERTNQLLLLSIKILLQSSPLQIQILSCSGLLVDHAAPKEFCDQFSLLYHQVLIMGYGQLYQNLNFDQNQFIGF